MYKDTKFCYSSFDISTFGFKAPPYWRGQLAIKTVPSKRDAFKSKDQVWMIELSDFLSDSQS